MKMADPTASVEKLQGKYKYWTGQISDAFKREKEYRKEGKVSVDLYEAKTPENVPFNILYSNIEVLAPAVYNARPIPIVQRRYKDADPSGKAVSDVSTRLLKYLIDTESENYDGFDDLVQASVLDGLATNRGVTRFKFVRKGEMECVYGEAVRWDKFFHGYSRTWKKVPWIGFEWDMTEDELRENFPEAEIDLSTIAFQASEDEADSTEMKDNLQGVKLYKVYEIWDKRTRKVEFYSSVHSSGPLKSVDDPLGLTGFFPIPRPLNFMRKITTLVPTPLYQQYMAQAKELNEITRRLKAIIKACKIRGAYNSTIEGIEKILSADDNEMIPVENLASMPDGAKMDQMLWIMPISDLVSAAQSLYQQREQVKTVIYEITGISDILRGASVASETATAQNIKNQWGSLRLKKMQKEVQRYVRDCLSIMLEIAGHTLELQTIMAMTGAPYLTEEQKAQVTQMQQMAQMAAAPQGPPGIPPMPAPQAAPAPELPPEVINAMKQPSWEAIQALLKDSLILHYKVDIETNSTIDAEAAQDKQDIAELLNALSQFLNGLGPLVQQGVMPFEIAQQMLLVISRRYTFGSQLEDAIMNMQAPKPESDPAAEQKAAAEQAKAQNEAAKAQIEMAKGKQEMELAQMEFEQKKQLMLLEFNIKKAELQLTERANNQKLLLQTAAHEQKMTQMKEASKTSAKEKEPA
jgi:hypothetical protein